uniref:Uncharacterized protein n=1 Tax=Kalanchoe fedtschenkoi TaxID=63787 RepID=A0A7N0U8V4_KALFE
MYVSCCRFTLIASGDLHPDAIICQVRNLLASQKAYCSELQDYHNGMVRNLLQLKDIWEECQDPMEFLPIVSRTSNYIVKGAFAPADEYKSQFYDPNLGGSSESLSAMEEERACSSDDRAVIVTRSQELQKRRGLCQDNIRSPILDVSDNQRDSRHRKGDKLSNCNIFVDGAKYMSYIKITKKQLELLKSMKQPGTGIQSKSVNNVLRNMDSYYVQPYSTFEEEEQRKLQNQWLLVVNTVHQASEDWTARRAQKEQIAKLLCIDLKENAKQLLQDEELPCCHQTDQKCSGAADVALIMDEDSVASLVEIQNTSHPETVDDALQGDNVDEVGSVENHGMLKMDLIPSRQEDMLDMASETDPYSNEIQASYSHRPPDFSCSSNSSFVNFNRGDTQSAVTDSRQTAKLPHPSHDSTLAQQYTPDASQLSCGDRESNPEHQPQFINSESDLHENAIELSTELGLPYRLTNQRTFSVYRNEDRNGLPLESIFRSSELSSYEPQRKQAGPHFHQTPSVMMGNVRLLPIQYQESLHQPHPFEVRRKRDERYLMNPHLPNNMLDICRGTALFSVPVPEHLPPFDSQEWHANSFTESVPLQTQSCAGDMFTQNWYSPGQQKQGGWSSPPIEVSIPNQITRSEASNNDESLFSVLSQCSELRSANSHHTGSTGQVMPAAGFGVTGGNIGRNSIGIPQTSHPMECISRRGAAPSLVPGSMSWVSAPQQNSTLHDPMAKPFLRSLNP